jgi:hypothetical protein
MTQYDNYSELYSINDIENFSISFNSFTVLKKGELLYSSKVITNITYSNHKFKLNSSDINLNSYITSDFVFDSISNIQDRLI